MSEQSLQLVTFHLADEEFGIDIKMVQEINRMINITKMPGTPAHVEGVVNLRGKVIPVVSLRKKLGFQEIERDKATRIMVVEIEGNILGFIVDSVSEVLRIDDAKIEPAPTLTGTTDSGHIEGVINLADRILMLLDLKALFGGDLPGAKAAA
ncbi:MAG TPA: chemotaxis protein CheW [Syntrophorhabdales bacterium]|nr:chemotaxis protein CheW [Syntrophorhabdales bacterium]